MMINFLTRTSSVYFLCSIVVAGSFLSKPALANEIELVTGEMLRGQVLQQSNQTIIFLHPVLGRLEIATKDIETVRIDAVPNEPAGETNDGELTAEPQAVDGETEAAPVQSVVDQPPAKRTLIPGWDSILELGFTGNDGNTKNGTIRVALNARKDNEHGHWDIGARFYHTRDQGETTGSQFIANITRNWLITDSKWFYFGRGNYERDPFQAWRHRVSWFSGVGYEMIATDELKLITRAGAGATRQFGEEDTLNPEATFSTELFWQIDDRQKLATSTTYLPQIKQPDESRIMTNAEWIISLNHARGISFKLGLENEYESKTSDDSKHNDVKYYGTLVFEF